jgi:hypothetical protein
MKARSLICMAVPVVASLALAAGPASAQTTMQVKENTPPPKPCASPVAFCGTASIAGYGSATFTDDITSVTNVSPAPCPFRSQAVSAFTYTMTDTFQLTSDGSTLVLDESGLACTPGNSQSGNTPGFPRYVSGKWKVDPASTGRFAGLTGSGTDVAHLAGASVSGVYSGTLG